MKAFSPTIEQEAAIAYVGACVITACPGSGKTAVVSSKVRNVLPTLPEYKGIIAISFTNKASNELKLRCSDGGINIKRSYFGTIDSFCISEIIRPFLPHFCIASLPEVEVVKKKNLNEEEKAAYNSGEEDFEKFFPVALQFMERGKIILESAAKLAAILIKASSAARSYVLARYTHLYIDEYQDSGEGQHSLFLNLHEIGLICIAVGDISQSIYAFNGGDPQFLRALCKRNEEFRHFLLTQNHRSDASIINYANRLLDEHAQLISTENKRVYRKPINGNTKEIAAWIDAIIEKVTVKFGVKNMNAIGILCRSSNTAASIHECLVTKSSLAQNSALDDRSEVEAAIIGRILRMHFSGDATVQSLWNDLNFKGDRLTRTKLRKVLTKCKSAKGKALIDAVFTASEIILGRAPSQEVRELLDAIVNDPDAQKPFVPLEDDSIQIMTLHKSKGLEFDVVFHLDLHEWVLPAKRIENGQSYFPDWEQDINLHYVGITRAREACFLVTSTKRTNSSKAVKNGAPSEFFELNGLHGLYSQLKAS